MTTTITQKQNPGCLLQILWFALVGIWLGQIWVGVAWFFMATVIGFPIGVTMMNKLPKVLALREPDRLVRIRVRTDGSVEQKTLEKPQVNIILRAIYFLVIGLWLSGIWMEIAYFFCATVIGLPVGFWMFDRVPAVLTLRRD